ncbi:dihydrofolate reductase family protein [Mucilaginibacter endophyticus]|uniref:dihydrofolate reductase family protein n=1 Tax=Mucilaginibacter endophyticus TaxID=2675003 RepID=UPI000E0D0C57|nr:dihydrofolate reductase family protein [Mucilaginibacter endophyticus]
MPPKSKLPYVVCHMMSSVDGKILTKNWADTKTGKGSTGLYEKVHKKYDSQAWMCGRVTMERDFADGLYTHDGEQTNETTDFVADAKAKSFAIAIDAKGKLAWKENNIDGDHLIEVLTTQVSQGYVDYLRDRGISYVFAGDKDVDLTVALNKITSLFPIKTIMLEGGGNLNGAMMKAGLVDELSLLLLPLADGTTATSVFETGAVTEMKLKKVKELPGGVLWLNYKVRKAK